MYNDTHGEEPSCVANRVTLQKIGIWGKYVGRWGGNGKTDVYMYVCVSIKRRFTEEKMTRFGAVGSY